MYNYLQQLQGDPNLLKMLNLGEYNSVHIHMNISMELKAVQQKFENFPSNVKLGLNKQIKGKKYIMYIYIGYINKKSMSNNIPACYIQELLYYVHKIFSQKLKTYL